MCYIIQRGGVLRVQCSLHWSEGVFESFFLRLRNRCHVEGFSTWGSEARLIL